MCRKEGGNYTHVLIGLMSNTNVCAIERDSFRAEISSFEKPSFARRFKDFRYEIAILVFIAFEATSYAEIRYLTFMVYAPTTWPLTTVDSTLVHVYTFLGKCRTLFDLVINLNPFPKTTSTRISSYVANESPQALIRNRTFVVRL